MCHPFLIRSWADPTHQYELNDIEQFRALYEPRGFYVATGVHSDAFKRAMARQAAAMAALRESNLLVGELADDVIDPETGDVVVAAGEFVFIEPDDADQPTDD